MDIKGNLETKLVFLRNSFRLNDEQLKRVVVGMPTLLGLNIDRNLQPKVDCLRASFGKNNEKSLREAVLSLPTLLGYSLEKRIRPRIEAIVRAGVDPVSISVGIPMSRDKFEKWLQHKEKKARNRRAIVHLASLRSAPQPASVESDKEPPRITHWTRPRRRKIS